MRTNTLQVNLFEWENDILPSLFPVLSSLISFSVVRFDSFVYFWPQQQRSHGRREPLG